MEIMAIVHSYSMLQHNILSTSRALSDTYGTKRSISINYVTLRRLHKMMYWPYTPFNKEKEFRQHTDTITQTKKKSALIVNVIKLLLRQAIIVLHQDLVVYQVSSEGFDSRI